MIGGMTTTDNAALLTRLLDEAAIRDATARFADAATSADYGGFRTLWADDAEWVIGGTESQPFERRAKGIGDIVSMFRTLRDERDYFAQFALPGSIEINGDDARTRCMCYEAARGPVRAATEIPACGLITYGARPMDGCSRAVRTNTCGSIFLLSPERPSQSDAVSQGEADRASTAPHA